MPQEIKNDEEYKAALREVEKYFLNPFREVTDAIFDDLVTAIEKYEEIHFPITVGEVKIGKFFIAKGMLPGRIWICRAADGEGADFPEEKLEEIIGRYYEENF